MIEMINKYLAAMQANRTANHEMELRYDGAIQVLEMMKDELLTQPKLETADGGRDPSTPVAEEAPTASPRKRARKVRTN
jgi:hypothetical protein